MRLISQVLTFSQIIELPPAVAMMENLEILNLFNNCLEEVPQSISGMPKLRILNLGINKLNKLPRGFGSFPNIEILDLSYNNLNEDSLPNNFFIMSTIRCVPSILNDYELILNYSLFMFLQISLQGSLLER